MGEAVSAIEAVEERGILFTTENVRAILEGRKTQTRRVAKFGINVRVSDGIAKGYLPGKPDGWVIPCPFGQPGDRLWVRETWARRQGRSAATQVIYRAGKTANMGGRFKEGWKSAMFMPRWASRITLEITKVRVERVQDISEADAVAEGITDDQIQECFAMAERMNQREPNPGRFLYEQLWDRINAKREGGKYAWAANPWTWVLDFRRVQ